MKEWYTTAELAEFDYMPNSSRAVAVKAKRNNWLSRKSQSLPNALEYHISNFHEDTQKMLVVMFGTKHEVKNGHETMAKFRDNAQRYRPSDNTAQLYSEKSSVYSSNILDMAEFDLRMGVEIGSLLNLQHQTGVFSVTDQLINGLGLRKDQSVSVICSDITMQPTINEGERILVDMRDLPHPVKDGVYIILIDNVIYIRRLKWNILNQSYKIIADNSEHDSFDMQGEDLKRFKVVGRVALVMRAL